MADVWILVNHHEDGDWSKHLAAVVLPNRKILSNNEEIEEILEYHFELLDKFWKEENGDAQMSSDSLYDGLNRLHRWGSIVSAEKAREAMEISGGF